MRVLFYIHALAGGGAERVCNTLANEFSRRGKDVFVSCNTERSINYTFDEKVKFLNHWEGCRTTKFWSNFKTYRFFRTLYNMRRIAKQTKPDFVIGVMTDYSLFAIVALAGLKIPVIATEHTNVDRMPSIYKKVFRLVYPFATAVTVLTRRDLKLWKNKFSNVVYMPNPLSVPPIQEQFKRNKWVLGVGRVSSPEKGFDSMVKCWNLLYKKHPDWKLVIAGKCDDNDIKNLCFYLDDGINSQIEFLGFRKDVYELMLQSEIFVLSSQYEGLPMGLMEAMSAGCCCVSFDVITGPSDIIHDKKSGLLVENQNINRLADALDVVMSDDNYRHKLSEQAPSSVTRFEKERIMNRWDVLFKRINNKNNIL